MKISQVHQAEYNPRKMSDKAKRALRTSIEEFGEISGIVWNKRTGNLIGGNHRWEQLCDLHGGAENLSFTRIKDTEFLQIKANNEFTGYLLREVDWDMAMEKAANITANSDMLMGEFTNDLQTILAEISDPASDVDEKLFHDLRLNELKFDLKIDDVKFEFEDEKDEVGDDFFEDDDSDIPDLVEPDNKKDTKPESTEFEVNILFKGKVNNQELYDDLKSFLEDNYQVEFISIKDIKK